jgi:hypothetical protein
MPRYDDKFVDRFLEPWNRHDVDGALSLMTAIASGRLREAGRMTPSSSVAVRTVSMTQSVFEQCIGYGLSPSRTISRRPCQSQAIIELGLTCSNPAPDSFLGLYD